MIFRDMVLVVVMSLLLPCVAFSPAETNCVLQGILHRMRMEGSHDDWSTKAREGNQSDVFPDMDALLSQVRSPGWNLSDKRQVFDWYLSTLAGSDVRSMTDSDKSQASVALAHCYDLSYTNAAPYYRRLAQNPHGVSRREAIRLYLKSVGVGPDATSFTESIMTNLQTNTSQDRFLVIRFYTDMILKRLNAGASVSPEIEMFLRNRNLDVTGAMTIDRFLVAGCEGYACSSNRFETSCFVLGNTNATQRMQRYFTIVTNELISSGQPLRRINVGRNE